MEPRATTVRVLEPARVSLAVGLVGLGALCFFHGTLVPQWQPMPPSFPWPTVFVYATGLVLVAGGASLFVPRLAPRAALFLTVWQLLWIAGEAPKLLSPRVSSLSAAIGVAEGLAEAVAATVGTFALWAVLGGRRGAFRPAQIVFGIACIVFGAAHVAFVDFTASMLPSWSPARALVYLTGGCHLAAGLALVTNVVARVAATLEAVMLAVFVLLIHLPSFALQAAWAPSRQIQWTELWLAVLIAGAAGVVAASCRDTTR